MNTCMNRTEENRHNTWNITAAALTNLNSTITYELQRNYNFHDLLQHTSADCYFTKAPYYRPPIQGG